MSSYDFTTTTLDRLISAVPDGSVAVCLTIPRTLYDALLETPAQRVTLNGSDVPINQMYEREFRDRLVWHDVATDWSGSSTRPAWEINREVLLHQRDLKHERGIRLYRGIPIVVTDETVCHVQWEKIEALVRGATV